MSKRKKSRRLTEPAEPAAEAPREERGRWGAFGQHALVAAGLVVLTLVVYRSTVELGWFAYDDESYVVRNPLLQELTGENLRRMLTEVYFTLWAPAHLLSYALDRAVAGGLEPAAFHLSSNLWAAACAVMVYLLGVVLLRRPWAAACAALLFVVHPAHVEAIAWISSRKDLVSTTFALASLLAWIRYREQGRRPRVWYGVAVACCLIAVAGKQSAVVLPAMAFLHDWLVEKRWDRSVIYDKIPLILVCVPFVLRSLGAQHDTGHGLDPFVIGQSTGSFLWLLTGFGEYVVYRPRPAPPAGIVLRILVIAVPVAAVAIPVLLRKLVPALVLVLVGWVLLALAPPQATTFVHTVWDRYLFLPSAAVVLLVGFGVERAVARWGRVGAIAAGVGVVALAAIWGLRTASYLEEWHHPLSVWAAAADKSTDFNVAFQLGSLLEEASAALPAAAAPSADAGARKEKERLRTLARELWAHDERLPALLAEWDSGTAKGPSSIAFRDDLRARALAQLDLAAARKGTTVSPNLFYRRGKLALESLRLDDAEREFQASLEEAARHTAAVVRHDLAVRGRHALGLVLWRRRDYPGALRWLEEAREIQSRENPPIVPELDDHIRRLKALAER